AEAPQKPGIPTPSRDAWASAGTPLWGQTGDNAEFTLELRLWSPPEEFDGEGQAMASLERRGNRFRVIFRLGGRKHHVSVKATDHKDAEACRVRLEENLRLVERGPPVGPPGAGPRPLLPPPG